MEHPIRPVANEAPGVYEDGQEAVVRMQFAEHPLCLRSDKRFGDLGSTIERILAKMSSSEFHRPVHDETGLTGQYDLKLEWTPDPDASSDAATPGLSRPATGASIFAAITETTHMG